MGVLFSTANPSASVSQDLDQLEETAKKCDQLWFDDGNVIILAGGTLFRIHRGILAAHSAVFQDILSAPRLEEPAIMDDCPFVQLPDDARDVEEFLKVYYVPGYLDFLTARLPLSVCGILRMSQKYGSLTCRRLVVRKLNVSIPTTFSQASMTFGLWQDLSYIPPGPSSCTFGYERSLLSCVIATASQCHIRAFLPSLFYMLGPLEVQSSETLDGQDSGCTAATAHICMAGWARLMQDFREIALASFIGNTSPCSRCDSRKLLCLRNPKNRKTFFGAPFQPLFLKPHALIRELPGLCDRCAAAMEKDIEQANEHVWHDLPVYFGLPRWDILLAELAEILRET
ncbi:hypothetical protein OE88DRAFT_1727034 [Heliocybe sulcata]|uniref:BTB domain-containing protein n=1 Tax=Heliocybe sulcata TaxID=5364 RepID=A0A5C3MZJ4_9AGAM|nr:hypothetical protein OE88DRAFT_1727034 [Heliocybe sulcata]